MIRICGVILSPNKHVSIALRKIYGVGKRTSLNICNKIDLNPTVKVCDLTSDYVILIQKFISNFELEGDLRRKVAINIKRLKDVKCYRGLRHKFGLPTRGQRTRTNSKTRKKNKKNFNK